MVRFMLLGVHSGLCVENGLAGCKNGFKKTNQKIVVIIQEIDDSDQGEGTDMGAVERWIGARNL